MKRHRNFKTSYLGLGMNFLDIFRAQNDCLGVGYLMGKEIFEFRLNLCLWQLFKEGKKTNTVIFSSKP